MMALKLAATLRTSTGKYDVDDIRNENQVPGNVYGKGKDAINVTVARKDLEALVRKSQREIEIELDGKVLEVKVGEVQYFPTGTFPIHVDFLYR